MNSILRQLANNPNAIGLEELRTMVSGGIVSYDDVKKVLGEQSAKWQMSREQVPCGENSCVRVPVYQGMKITAPKRMEDYTKVFVWGNRGSGKTCVIGSLLAHADEQRDETITVDASDGRAVALKKCFSDKGQWAVIPDEADRSERMVNVHSAVLRQRSTPLTHRSYPITFVEVPLTLGVKGGAIAKDILDTEGEQIHLLCLDCSADIMLQQQMFNRLLDYLDENGYIHTKTAGVYVVVTKCDTMYRVPRQYRDMAAQTMVTAKLKGLWQKVSGICYDKGIYGATPILYTVGDVRLQCVVRYELSSAEQLWHKVILPKSQPMVSGLERVLRWGNGSLTAAVFIAVVALAGYGLFGVLNPDATPPSAENLPYDYKKEFIDKVKANMQGRSYSQCKGLFVTMNDDLKHEHSIRNIDNDLVLSDKDYASCDSALSNTFAECVNDAIDNEMGMSSWHDDLLRELLSKGSMLQDHRLDLSHSNALEEKTQLIKTYFNEVKPLLAKVKNCQSLSDVEYVIDNSEKYNEAPFTANADIANALDSAKQSCIRSYSNYLRQKASVLEASNEDKSSYKTAMDGINSSIDEFMTYLNDNGFSQFVSDLDGIKEALQETYDNISTSWFDFLRF